MILWLIQKFGEGGSYGGALHYTVIDLNYRHGLNSSNWFPSLDQGAFFNSANQKIARNQCKLPRETTLIVKIRHSHSLSVPQ